MASESIYIAPGQGMAIGGTITGSTVTKGILIEDGGALAENSSFRIVTSGGFSLVMGNDTITTSSGTFTYTLPEKTGTFAMTSDIGGLTVGSSVTSGTNGRVFYQWAGNIAQSANFTFDTNTLTLLKDGIINGLTVGQGHTSSLLSTAVGYQALNAVTTSQTNTAIGYQSLLALTTGDSNDGVGYLAASTLITGDKNSAFGAYAMYNCGSAVSTNQAYGRGALRYGTGNFNAAYGYVALGGLSFSGAFNTALGNSSGLGMTTGTSNTTLGYNAGAGITTGTQNIIIPVYQSGPTGGSNVITGSNNVIIGGHVGTSDPTGRVELSTGDGSIMFSNNVISVNYGTTTTVLVTDDTYTISVGAGGSGATTINLPTGTNSPIGTIYVIKDIGCNASANNITIDAGATNSNKIAASTQARTVVISINGQCLTLQRLTAVIWGIM